MSKIISSVNTIRVRLPLRSPYRLSFTTLDNFDTIYSKVTLTSGEWGIGETIPLHGYGWEDADGSEDFLTAMSNELIGMSTDDAWRCLHDIVEDHPFAITAPLTALEYCMCGWGSFVCQARVELVTLVDPVNKNFQESVARLLDEGVKTFKLKLGTVSINEELRMIAELYKVDWNDSRLRFDCNQAYSFEEAMLVAEKLKGLPIEFFEQPLGVDKWDEMAELNRYARIPTMLDESIYGEDSVDRVIREKTSNAIKLKLMKCGSMNNMRRLIIRARKNGLSVVIGNGVGGPLSCSQETIIHAQLGLKTAGEMNGAFKLVSRPFEEFLKKAGNAVEFINADPSTMMSILDRLYFSGGQNI